MSHDELSALLYGDLDGGAPSSSLVADEVRAPPRARVVACYNTPLLTVHHHSLNLAAMRRQLRFERDAALREVAALKEQTVGLEARLAASATACAALETNISSLYLTAKAEIARKDRVIAELRAAAR